MKQLSRIEQNLRIVVQRLELCSPNTSGFVTQHSRVPEPGVRTPRNEEESKGDVSAAIIRVNNFVSARKKGKHRRVVTSAY